MKIEFNIKMKRIDNSNYAVSTLGTVYNLKTGRELKLITDKDGYHIVNIYIDKKMYTKRVHRLVAEAFITNSKESTATQVNHIDADKTNNRVENLEWCTPRENIHHAFAHGLCVNPEGLKAKAAIFNAEDIRHIRFYLHNKMVVKDIAEQYNCSLGTIYNIINRKTYLDVA